VHNIYLPLSPPFSHAPRSLSWDNGCDHISFDIHKNNFNNVWTMQILTKHKLKGIVSILDQNLDHRDFVYLCMELKECRDLNSHAVMFGT